MTKHQLHINNRYLSANVGMTDSTLLKKKKLWNARRIKFFKSDKG